VVPEGGREGGREGRKARRDPKLENETKGGREGGREGGLTSQHIHRQGLEGELDKARPLQPLAILIEAVERHDEPARQDGSGHVARSQDEGDILIRGKKGGELHAHAAHIGLEGGREGGVEGCVGDSFKIFVLPISSFLYLS